VNVLLVAAGGAAGSVLRYLLDRGITYTVDIPAAGTISVNVLGSFGIGMFLGLSDRLGWSQQARVLVATGLFGGFTTFSALSWQTLRLAENGDVPGAASVIAVSIVFGLLAVWGGATIGRAIA
jgi:CrcB protein